MAVTSHKDVSGLALVPSFFAGAITGMCALSLSVGVAAKFIAEEWKTPIRVSFIDQLSFQNIQLAEDHSIEQNLIRDTLVIKRKVYKLKRSVVVAKAQKVKKLETLAPVVITKAAPLPLTEVKTATPPAVYSAFESGNFTSESVRAAEPKTIESIISESQSQQSSEDEYSRMMSLRNTFVASLIGEMTTQQPEPEAIVVPEKAKDTPIINKTNHVKKLVLEKKVAKIFKKKPAKKSPAQAEKVTQVVENKTKVELKRPEYSSVSTQKFNFVKSKKSEVEAVIAAANEKQDVAVVIEKPKVEIIKPEVVPAVVAKAVELPKLIPQPVPAPIPAPEVVPAVVAKTEFKEEKVEEPIVEVIKPKAVMGELVSMPEPLPVVVTAQSAPVQQPAPVVEPKKVEAPQVVSWSISPALLQSLTTPKKQPEILTITTRANNDSGGSSSAAQQPAPAPVNNNIGNFASLAKTSEPAAPTPQPAPPTPVTPVPVVEKPICETGVCFERWLATQAEKLNVLSFSLNHIPAKKESKEWLITDEEKSLPTLYFGLNDGFVPLINKAEFEQAYKISDDEGFLLVRNNKDWLVKSEQILKEVNSISYSKAPLDKLYTKLQPGMKLIEIIHKETKEKAAVALPVMRGHVTFLDLSQPEQHKVVITTDAQSSEGQILNISWVGLGRETIYRTGKKPQSAEFTTFGKYPIVADVKSVGGFSHRYLVFQKARQVEMNLEILKDSQVERFLKMLEGGVSSESGMVFGKVPLSQIGSDLRIDPSRKSKSLIPELYYYNGSLNEEDQVLIPHTQANAKVRNFVGVQIPKGMLLLSLEKPSGDKNNIQLHMAQPGVINVYQPE